MPGTPTTKYALPTMAGADIGNTIDDWTVSFGAAVDSKLAPSDQGAIGSRPTSTPGSPGKAGRTYFDTGTGTLYRDNGTGWDTVLTGVGHAAMLGVNADGVIRRGRRITAGLETRDSGVSGTGYGLMPTPDQVSGVVLPADGLIFIAYQAIWRESVSGAARASVFLNNQQIKQAVSGAGTPLIQETGLGPTPGGFAGSPTPLTSAPGGLVGGPGDPGYAGTATTGQILGASRSSGGAFGYMTVFAAAATYTIDVQFKASSGTVGVQDRHLWVWTIGF